MGSQERKKEGHIFTLKGLLRVEVVQSKCFEESTNLNAHYITNWSGEI